MSSWADKKGISKKDPRTRVKSLQEVTGCELPRIHSLAEQVKIESIGYPQRERGHGR